jgi:hypothetical protein
MNRNDRLVVVHLLLREEDVKTTRRIAKKLGTAYQALLRCWIAEKVIEESKLSIT